MYCNEGDVHFVHRLFFGDNMQEATYQRRLIKKLQVLFPGCVVVKNDPSENQGIPDILILFRNMWAMLEVKVSPVAPEQPNQVYWVDAYNEMSFAAFINPQNEEQVLYDLQSAFGVTGKARVS